jgi:hypothetical protein
MRSINNDVNIDDRHAKDVAIYCEDKSGTIIDMRINILSQKGLVKAGLWLAYIELFGGLNT